MEVIKGELFVTSAELVVAPAVLDLIVGPLSRIPQVKSTRKDEDTVQAFFDKARPKVVALYRAAMATLADPARIGVLHYALGEESLTRAILAWGPATGEEAVMMVSSGRGWAIRQATPKDLTNTIASVLLEETPLTPAKISMTLSQDSAFVFLGVLHLLRLGRLRALLAYDASPVAFTTKAISEALESAGIEDFRWPLFFYDKVLPFSLSGLSWAKKITPALRELASRGLVERVKKHKDTWILTSLGYQLAVADSQHFTKVGVRITESGKADLKSHEAFLFMRSLQDVVMYDLGGREAVIASINMGDLRSLMENILTPPVHTLKPRPAGKPADFSPPATGATKTRSRKSSPSKNAPSGSICASCGYSLGPNAKFCPNCGATVGSEKKGKICANCGAALGENAKFCASCGKSV